MSTQNNCDERPYVNVKIANQIVSSLADSGATASTCSSIGAKCLQALGYKLLKANLPVNGKLADGSVVNLKRFFSIPVEFNNKLVLMIIFVLENSPIDNSKNFRFPRN